MLKGGVFLKLPKEILAHIEFELSHYAHYKEILEYERNKILEDMPSMNIAFSKNKNFSNPTEKKAFMLLTSMTIMSLERSVHIIERTISCLDDLHKKVFEMYYLDGKKDINLITLKLSLSRETFYRYRKRIIEAYAYESGVAGVIDVIDEISVK